MTVISLLYIDVIFITLVPVLHRFHWISLVYSHVIWESFCSIRILYGWQYWGLDFAEFESVGTSVGISDHYSCESSPQKIKS